MEYIQSKFSNKINFNFKTEGLQYSLSDRSGSRNTFIKYEDIFLNQNSTVTERNEYFRNVGFLWIVIGLVGFSGNFEINIWFILGAVCLAGYFLVSSTFTIIQSSAGNILVLHNAKHDEIIELLTKKVHGSIIENVGSINYDREFEQERRKYKSLLEAGIIGESQFNGYLSEMEKNKDKFKLETD